MAEEVWCELRIDFHHKIGLSQTRPGPGNFIYANLMGMPVFVISDPGVAEELLNVRGRISAGRPPNILGTELYVALSTRKPAINKSYQNGLGRMEFGIDSAGKDALRGTFASTESYNSRCH
jgi:hypothetical protein